jgi:hypothetical protein
LKFLSYFFFSESWISWPLAFLFANDDGNKNDVTLRYSTNNFDNESKYYVISILLSRFRHLDVRVGSSRRNSQTGGSSPSPENENGTNASKSPKRSPLMLRKKAIGSNGLK